MRKDDPNYKQLQVCYLFVGIKWLETFLKYDMTVCIQTRMSFFSKLLLILSYIIGE